METTTDLLIRVTVTDRSSLDRQLDEAEGVAMVRAWQEGKGILVTRHDHGIFTVALSDVVPYGITRERYE